MRACYVVSGLGIGGAEFSLLRLCRALRSQGVATSVISVSDVGELGPRFESEGIEVLALDLPRFAGITRALRNIRSHLRQTQPDLVHGWMYHGNVVATLLGRSDGVHRPALWAIRQSLEGNQDKLLTRLLIRLSALLSSRPDAIIYNSALAKAQHEAAGFSARSAEVIPNGFEVDRFRPDAGTRARVRASLGISSSELCIGHVARFHPSKDHATFLRAVERVSRNRRITALCAGAGVDEANPTLRALIDELGLAGRVRLLGSQEETAELMASLDLFCSSSSGMEGFPNVVAEAMSCAVPCVVTEVGDAPSVVGAFGGSVPPRDPDALAAALEQLIALPTGERYALGRGAREHIVTHYAIDAVASRYRALYESLAAPRGASACAA